MSNGSGSFVSGFTMPSGVRIDASPTTEQAAPPDPGEGSAFDAGALEAAQAADAAVEAGEAPPPDVEEAPPAPPPAIDEDQAKIDAWLEKKRRAVGPSIEQQRLQEQEQTIVQLQRVAQQQQAQVAQMAAFIQSIRENPAEALGRLGVDPREHVTRIAEHELPTAKLQRQMEQQAQENQRIVAALQQELGQVKGVMQQQYQWHQAAVRDRAIGELQYAAGLPESGSAGKMVMAFYKDNPQELADRAYEISQAYVEETGARGCPPSVILKALARQVAPVLENRYKEMQQLFGGELGGVTPGVTGKQDAEPSVPGLGKKAAGTRRTHAKVTAAMDPDERRAALQAMLPKPPR